MTPVRDVAVLGFIVGTAVLRAQEPAGRRIAQARAQAELDAPKLVEALELKPGTTVADVGAGGGAITVVLGHWIGHGHVSAGDKDPAYFLTLFKK